MDQPKQRDAERSRAAILDAAEALFAEHGYEAVTLAQVGAAAGVSRGTPGYFFGTKDALYALVVERAAAVLREHVAASGQRLDQVVAALLDLLVRRPSLVKLIDQQRGGRVGEPHAEAFRDALGGAGDDRVALVALALCWFPMSHPGAARAFGVDPQAPGFARSWRDHVVAAIAAATSAAPVATSPPVAVSEAPAPSAVSEAVSVAEQAPDDEGDSSKKKKKKKKKKG